MSKDETASSEEIKFIDDETDDSGASPHSAPVNFYLKKVDNKKTDFSTATLASTNTSKQSLRSSVKKDRGLKFNINSTRERTDDLPSFGDDRNNDSILPVLEILDQMKTYAKINQNKLEFQKKAKNSRKQKIFGSPEDSSFCSPKKIKEYLVSIRSNLYYFLERPVGMIGLFYRLFTFTLIVGKLML